MSACTLTKRLVQAGLLSALGCLASSAVVAQSAPEEQRSIRVLSRPNVDASSPQAAVWQEVPATEVVLEPAFPGHESIVGTPVTERLTAQAVRAGDRLFVKLVWSDRTANTTVEDTAAFLDGAAVQFPINGKEDTSPFMGDVDNPVNVWHWSASGHTENLVAHGYGSATRVPSDDLTGVAVRTDDGWAVVMSRSLQADLEEGATLPAQGAMPVAFAAWDGQNQERDGLKAVTLDWWRLLF